jgi:iron complex outermembrane recepter protein
MGVNMPRLESKPFQRTLLAAVVASLAGGSIGAYAQGLEEVIVTAQKREQGLQDVPISVEAFTADQLDNLGAEDLGDIGTFTANVTIGKQSNQPSYTIRGIGTSDFGIGADPAVGVYLDGVYIGRSGGSKVAFNDIARVEILNGPQGTLFGRNAAAGAIQYVTNKPTDILEGWSKVTVGNYDRQTVEGVVNVPLTDTLSTRTGFLWHERDGWVDNVFNGDNLAQEGNRSINTQLLWTPSETLDVLARLEYDEIDQDSRPASSAVWGPRDGKGPDFEKVESDEKFDEKRYLFGSSLHVNWETEFASVTSITSWRTYNSRNPEEKDGSAEIDFSFNDSNAEKNKQFSQEFRLDGEAGEVIRWTAGVNYFWEHAEQTSGIMLTPQSFERLAAEREIGLPVEALPDGAAIDLAFLIFPDPDGRRAYANGMEALAGPGYSEWIDIDAEYKSYAAFTDVTWDITDTVSLTGGLRYSKDEKEFSRFVEFNEWVIAFAFPTETRVDGNGNYDANGELGWLTSEDEWSQTTPRAVLNWDVADDVMLYASYSEGYKAGGFNSAGEILAPSFDPEEITNYELGMKSSWFDNTLRVNGAVFSYEYDNLQALSFIDGACLPGSSVGAYLFETSDLEGKGAELSLTWLPLPELELFFNTGLLDAEYTSREERRVVDGSCQTIDRSGESFADSEINFSVGGTYTFSFDGGAEVMLSAAYNFEEGAKRDECTHVVNNAAAGRPSDIYRLTEINGELIISDPSATGDLTEAPFGSCPDSDDFEQLNVRAAYYSADGKWEVGAFVTNATDWAPEHSDPGGLGNEMASNFSDGSPSYDYRRTEPRMYGLELRYNFE